MKTTVLSFVVTLSAFTTISHAGCNQQLLRAAESLRCNADSLVSEFQEEIEHKRVCSDERRFMESLCVLENQTDRFFSDVRSGDDPACLQRSFCSIKQTFDCAQRTASEIRVCSCVRELMGKFSRTLCSIESQRLLVPYEAPRHRHSDYSDSRYSGHRDDRPSAVVRPEAVLLQGLIQILQRR